MPVLWQARRHLLEQIARRRELQQHSYPVVDSTVQMLHLQFMRLYMLHLNSHLLSSDQAVLATLAIVSGHTVGGIYSPQQAEE